MTAFIADERIARGYADRPFLHRQVMEMVQADCPGISFANGLYVGCGAGLSVKALRLICRRVTGIDVSGDMIAAARAACTDPACTFVCGSGEAPDFPEKTFDIITAAGHGFRPQKQVSFVLEQPFAREGLVNFLMLQSCVAAQIRRHGLDAEKVRRRLADSLETVCGEQALLYFDGYYRRYSYYGNESDTGAGQKRTDVGGGGGAVFPPPAL